jgi:hypothetical protein
MASTVVAVILILGTLGVHLGNYCLRQQRDWRAKGLLVLGCVLAMGVAAQYYVNARKDAEIELLKPRHVSDAQKNRLSTALTTRRGRIGFKSKFLDGESFSYAVQLQDVFRSARWEVEEAIDRTSTNALFGFLGIRFTDPNLLDLTKFVCETLKDTGIDCRPVDIPANTFTGGMKENSIYIFVGQKK